MTAGFLAAAACSEARAERAVTSAVNAHASVDRRLIDSLSPPLPPPPPPSLPLQLRAARRDEARQDATRREESNTTTITRRGDRRVTSRHDTTNVQITITLQNAHHDRVAFGARAARRRRVASSSQLLLLARSQRVSRRQANSRVSGEHHDSRHSDDRRLQGSCIIVLAGVGANRRAVQMGCTMAMQPEGQVDKAGGRDYHYCNNDRCNDAVFFGAPPVKLT